jgi:hypothetical protein
MYGLPTLNIIMIRRLALGFGLRRLCAGLALALFMAQGAGGHGGSDSASISDNDLGPVHKPSQSCLIASTCAGSVPGRTTRRISPVTSSIIGTIRSSIGACISSATGHLAHIL